MPLEEAIGQPAGAVSADELFAAEGRVGVFTEINLALEEADASEVAEDQILDLHRASAGKGAREHDCLRGYGGDEVVAVKARTGPTDADLLAGREAFLDERAELGPRHGCPIDRALARNVADLYRTCKLLCRTQSAYLDIIGRRDRDAVHADHIGQAVGQDGDLDRTAGCRRAGEADGVVVAHSLVGRRVEIVADQ